MSGGDRDWEDAETPERLYVITGGRADSPATAGLGLVTLIVARAQPKVGMQPEHAAILRMCGAPLSVAEISAYLRLPVSVTTVLLTDLLDEELVQTRNPAPVLPDIALIEAVIDGLSKL
jgi:hypothetical protein